MSCLEGQFLGPKASSKNNRCRARIVIFYQATSGVLITAVTKKFVQNVPVVQPLRSVQAVEEGDGQDSTSFGTRDRRRYLHWVFEAKKRFGLSVLNYTVTSNHIHLLVNDTGSHVIAQTMQLIAGRTAQEYKPAKRAARSVLGGPLYHATAIEADEHLASLSGLHRSQHGSRYRLLKPVPGVPNVQPLRSVQDVSDKRSFKVQGSMFGSDK